MKPTDQPTLPFRQLRFPARHVHWLKLANAAVYHDRRAWFYPLKSALCREHGITDGYDLQVITKKCWCGDGIWRGINDTLPKDYWEACWRCNGTGIYSRKQIFLIRWIIGGALFHEPADHFPAGREYKERFEGLIEHEYVDPKVGHRCMLRLMLRYKPEMFWRYWRLYFQSIAWDRKCKIRLQWRRVVKLFKKREQWEADGVPF